jgi:aldose 1-epimerase
MTEDVIRLQKAGFTVDVSPLGGAILSATWNDIPVLVPTLSPGLASQVLGAEACFPLVPFGNRIEGNCFRFEGVEHALLPNTTDPLVLHGDGWLQRWTILQQTQESVVFHYRHRAGRASPFAYDVTEAIVVENDAISLSLTVTNLASQRLPYGLGFHPYFARTPQMRLFADATRCWSERENHLPGRPSPLPADLDVLTGTTLPPRWLNNAFDGWDGKARVKWPENSIAMSLTTDAGFSHFVLYSPSAESEFFCVEPMSHRPNAHLASSLDGLVRLDTGSQMSRAMRLSLEKTKP